MKKRQDVDIKEAFPEKILLTYGVVFREKTEAGQANVWVDSKETKGLRNYLIKEDGFEVAYRQN